MIRLMVIFATTCVLLMLFMSATACMGEFTQSNPIALLNNPIVNIIIILVIVYWALKRK